MKSRKSLIIGLVTFLSALGVGRAVPITYTGNNGSQGASATFDIVGTTLTVRLAGTTGDVLNPSGVLTTVFFNLGGSALTPVSALVPAGNTVVNGTAPGGNVGGEWSYATGFSVFGANSGISSTGLGFFPGSGNFGGADLDGIGNGSPAWGLLTASDNFATGNPQVTAGGLALISSAVVFTLNGVTPGSAITNVTFQWGTSLTEPSAPGVPGDIPTPVPEGGATIALLGAGLIGLGLIRRAILS